MNDPHHRPVAAGFPESGNGGVEFFLGNFRDHFPAEALADRLHFARHSGIFVGQVGVVRPGIDDAQGVARGGEVEVYGADVRMVLVREVDGHQAAHSRGRLVHQAAGLAEEHVLSVLADLGDLRLGHPGIKEQVVDDGANQHLEGSRRTEAGTGQNRGLAVSIEAPHLAAQLDEPCRHAPNQSRGVVNLRRHRLQGIQADLAQGVSLGLDPDHIGAIGANRRHRIQIHGTSQNTAPLMVRMVAADLRAARRGEVTLRRFAKGGGKTGIQFFLVVCGKNQCRHNSLPK